MSYTCFKDSIKPSTVLRTSRIDEEKEAHGKKGKEFKTGNIHKTTTQKSLHKTQGSKG